MEHKNYFVGKYTLNKKFVLRRSFLDYTIYDIHSSTASEINLFFYTVLNYFLHNATNLSEIGHLLSEKNVPHNLETVQELIHSRADFADLLIESDVPFQVSNPYKNLPKDQISEYTPEAIDLLITNKCNLTCPHCYRNSTAKDKIQKIPLERFYTLVDEMEELRVRSLKITGGEAFLVKELYDIVNYASSKRLHVGILSNATLPLENKWWDLLIRPNVFLGISLDGVTPETNDIVRGKGSFNRTIHNLKTMSEKGVRFTITFTVNKHNQHELEEIVLLAMQLKAKSLNINFIEESGRALDNKTLYKDDILNIPEVKKKIKILQEKYPIKIEITDNHGLASTEEDLKKIRDKKDHIICSAAFSTLAIDSSLTAYPCIYGIGGKKEYPVASLLNRSLKDVWNDPALHLFRGGLKTQDLPKCKDCEDQALCNLKYCRLRPIYEGGSLYDVVSFCKKEMKGAMIE